MMMTDYNEMCLEREDLLYSLADVRLEACGCIMIKARQ